jgi:hypothetical protein
MKDEGQSGQGKTEAGTARDDHRPIIETLHDFFPVFRRVFNAPPHAMTWFSMSLTDCSFVGPGLKTLKFSKSVYNESKT